MDIIILILASWRISNLIVNESGPYNIIEKFRDFIGIKYDDLGQSYETNEFATGLNCVWCNSIWLGIGWTILYLIFPTISFYLALPFAISTGAILINEAIKWREQIRQHY